MIEQQEKIRAYFNAWIDNNVHVLQDILSDDILYSECYGPEYRGLNQVNIWFTDWNKCGAVRRWDIKQFVHQKNISVVEWYFECIYDNTIDGFDGVSLIEFGDDGKIISIKEFQSKSEHYFPYSR